MSSLDRRQFALGALGASCVLLPTTSQAAGGPSNNADNHKMTFIDRLTSSSPASDRAEALALYGWLNGEWEFDATVNLSDGTIYKGLGTITASWILAGRALQDVWVLPQIYYGTTVRVYDPEIQAWRISWVDPYRGYYVQQIGRAADGRIVQEGVDQRGVLRRWTFSNMAKDEFRWIGELRKAANETWQLQSDYRARRIRR